MDNKQENVPASTPAANTSDYQDVVKTLVKAQHEVELRSDELATAKEKLEKLEANVEKLTSYFAEGTKVLADVMGAEAVSKLDSAETKDFFSVLAGEISEKLSCVSELETQLSEAKEKIEALEVEKRSIARRTEIANLLAEYISDEEARAAREEKMVSATKSLSDEAFAEALEDTKELLGLAAKPDAEAQMDGEKMKEDEKKDEKEKGKMKKSASEGVTDAGILDTVKATASLSAGSEEVASNNENEGWSKLSSTLLKYGKNK